MSKEWTTQIQYENALRNMNTSASSILKIWSMQRYMSFSMRRMANDRV